MGYIIKTISEFVQKYMSSVADAMDKLPLLSMGDTPSESAQQQVNTQYDSICHLIHQSVESNIPTQRPNQKTVKWWNKDCTATRNRNRLYHHIWKCCGRPSTGCVYECYKATRKSYRRSCRQAVQNKTQNTLQILEKLYQDRKCHQFWKVIRRLKQDKKDAINLHKLVDHFSGKFSKPDLTTEGIQRAKHRVQAKYDSLMNNSSQSESIFISEFQIKKYIKKLSKTSCMTMGCYPFTTVPQWSLDNVVLNNSEIITYLGAEIGDLTGKAHSDIRTHKALRAFYALQGAGVKYPGVSTQIALDLYKTSIRIPVSDSIVYQCLDLCKNCVLNDSIASDFYCELLLSANIETAKNRTLLGRAMNYVAGHNFTVLDYIFSIECQRNFKQSFKSYI